MVAIAPSCSDVTGAKGLEVGPLAAALPKSEGLVATASPGQEAVIALNTAFMTDGALVRIADGAKLAKPLLLVFARASNSRASSPRATSFGSVPARAPR